MEFLLPIEIKPLKDPISYEDKILLTGSCFTEHIGNTLQELKFDVLQNPNGILFDPLSVAGSLVSYVEDKQYTGSDLFYLNELWQSWQHHSAFSNIDQQECLRTINESQHRAHTFLREAKWLVITLGSSFSYRLADQSDKDQASPAVASAKAGVANCHRAPAQWFRKHLMTIEEINTALDNCIHRLFQFNPGIRIIFTVSPVRHVRDGVIENNRSKARLIETVHNLAGKFENIHYFPAYELLIDVLRDYRFYDKDLVHPNYAATEFILEKFAQYGIDPGSQAVMQEIKKLVIARKHKAFQPATKAHQQFLQDQLEKTKQLQARHPYLDLQEELSYFSEQPAKH
jgi:lysophospholipase L1-like esterase